MNRFGTLDIGRAAARAPKLTGLKDAPIVLKDVHVLDVRAELQSLPADALIPPSLRPGIPSYGSLAVMQVGESPFGPFSLAEVRIGVRIGGISALFLAAAVCDSEPARKALAERRGYRAITGEIELQELYYQVTARVVVHGDVALQVRMTERRTLPGTRLNVPSLVNLARVDGRPTLVNTPVQLAFAQADGGGQAIEALNGEALGLGEGFRPAFPMSAVFGTAEVTLGSPDYTLDPVLPPEESIEAVA